MTQENSREVKCRTIEDISAEVQENVSALREAMTHSDEVHSQRQRLYSIVSGMARVHRKLQDKCERDGQWEAAHEQQQYAIDYEAQAKEILETF